MSLNKKVLITGSSSGIGLGIAKAFDDSGFEVILTGRNLEKLLTAVSEQKKSKNYFCGDLTNSDEIKKISEQHSDIDILICNLGSGKSVPTGSESIEEWRRVFELNFFSTVQIIEAYRKILIKNKGQVICISSICANTAIGAPATYSVAKAALNAYVNNMSRFFGENDVRLNCVTPGNIIFSGSTWESKLKTDAEKVNRMLETEVPLRKFGTPDDIGKACLFLCSSDAQFIHGMQLVVDGGQQRIL